MKQKTIQRVINRKRGKSALTEVCIVIPTYNEAQNIESLLDRIFLNEKNQQSTKGKVSINVFVVDDNSPDGTMAVVQRYQKKNQKVHLLLREKKEGLGAAYIAGMKHAIEMLQPDVIFEMDGDHSHNPEDISRMMIEIEKGADFVIGSRYVSGGSIPENWGIHRKIISMLACSITRIGLGIKDIKDCSGGFRAIRVSALQKIDLDSLKVKGYAFQAALLEEMLHNRFKVKEIPIAFDERLQGDSKMTFKDMFEGFVVIGRIRMKRIFSKIKEEIFKQ